MRNFFFLTYDEFKNQVKSIILNTNCGYNDTLDMPTILRNSILNSLIEENDRVQKMNTNINKQF